MTLILGFIAFLTWTAFLCKADCPPLTFSYEWLDAFTVNVSWVKPTGLQCSSEEQCYRYHVMEGQKLKTAYAKWTNFTENCLTEDMNVGGCNYSVWTINQLCSIKSTPATITVSSPKPQAEVVKDVECFKYPNKIKCSWILVNQSQNLKVSYRVKGKTEEVRNKLKVCKEPRSGCELDINTYDFIYIHVESEAGMRTFIPKLKVHSPKMEISEEEKELNLSWTPPEVWKCCGWIYEVCYNRCNKPKECQNYPIEKGNPHTVKVETYDRNCRYEFTSRVRTNNYHDPISSDLSQITTYGNGTDKPPDYTLTVVAIVIPIILSACVLLSCFCFRRHSAIFCPIIPDPSVIFKEMMMNGNKELKTTTGSLYTPVPEPIEPCKIALVSENCVVQKSC